MLVKLVQPANANSPIDVTLFGISMFVKPPQAKNAEPEISTVSSFKVIFVFLGISPLYLYATFPAYTNPSGWLLYHGVSSNAPCPILVTLLGIITLVRFVQQENAKFPMLVTLLGNSMLVRLSQDSNAKFVILITSLGITYSPDFPAGYSNNFVFSLLNSTPSIDE